MNRKDKANHDVQEKKYPLLLLRENCVEIFGCTSSTFDGATFGMSGSFSKKEIANAIEKYLNKPLIKGGK